MALLGKAFFFFSPIALIFHLTRHAVTLALPKPLIRIMTYSLTWLLWNARSFSSFSFIYSLIFSSSYLFFLPTGCQEQPATRLTKASDRHMARPNEASLSLLGSQELRSSVVICSSQFNTWDAQHRWALVLIVCFEQRAPIKACFVAPKGCPGIAVLRVRPTPTIGGMLIV